MEEKPRTPNRESGVVNVSQSPSSAQSEMLPISSTEHYITSRQKSFLMWQALNAMDGYLVPTPPSSETEQRGVEFSSEIQHLPQLKQTPKRKRKKSPDEVPPLHYNSSPQFSSGYSNPLPEFMNQQLLTSHKTSPTTYREPKTYKEPKTYRDPKPAPYESVPYKIVIPEPDYVNQQKLSTLPKPSSSSHEEPKRKAIIHEDVIFPSRYTHSEPGSKNQLSFSTQPKPSCSKNKGSKNSVVIHEDVIFPSKYKHSAQGSINQHTHSTHHKQSSSRYEETKKSTNSESSRHKHPVPGSHPTKRKPPSVYKEPKTYASRTVYDNPAISSMKQSPLETQNKQRSYGYEEPETYNQEPQKLPSGYRQQSMNQYQSHPITFEYRHPVPEYMNQHLPNPVSYDDRHPVPEFIHRRPLPNQNKPSNYGNKEHKTSKTIHEPQKLTSGYKHPAPSSMNQHQHHSNPVTADYRHPVPDYMNQHHPHPLTADYRHPAPDYSNQHHSNPVTAEYRHPVSDYKNQHHPHQSTAEYRHPEPDYRYQHHPHQSTAEYRHPAPDYRDQNYPHPLTAEYRRPVPDYMNQHLPHPSSSEYRLSVPGSINQLHPNQISAEYRHSVDPGPMNQHQPVPLKAEQRHPVKIPMNRQQLLPVRALYKQPVPGSTNKHPPSTKKKPSNLIYTEPITPEGIYEDLPSLAEYERIAADFISQHNSLPFPLSSECNNPGKGSINMPLIDTEIIEPETSLIIDEPLPLSPQHVQTAVDFISQHHSLSLASEYNNPATDSMNQLPAETNPLDSPKTSETIDEDLPIKTEYEQLVADFISPDNSLSLPIESEYDNPIQDLISLKDDKKTLITNDEVDFFS